MNRTTRNANYYDDDQDARVGEDMLDKLNEILAPMTWRSAHHPDQDTDEEVLDMLEHHHATRISRRGHLHEV